jgi:hypothetical protein
MSNLLFQNEVNQLKKIGVPEDMAILVASGKLEDKTVFNFYINKMREENELIAKQVEMLGFKPFGYVEPNNDIKSIDNVKEDEPSSTEKVKDI